MKALDGLDWLDRVRQERDDLAEKMHRLFDFVSDEKKYDVSPEMCSLLNLQYIAMRYYKDILDQRIDLGEKEREAS